MGTTLEYLMKRWASIFAKVRFVYENHPPVFWRFLRWLLFLRCKRKLNCEFRSVRKAVARMNGKPAFFIHGERDSHIPSSQAEMLYALAGEPKYLWIVPGARHNESVVIQPTQYARRITAFFGRHLGEIETEDDVLETPSHGQLSQPLATLGAKRAGNGRSGRRMTSRRV